MIIDPAVYDAIAQSPFLKEQFSAFSESTQERDNGAGTIRITYLTVRGRQTHLTIFKPAQLPQGRLTFHLWIDDREKLPLIRDSLAKETLLQPEIRLERVLIDGKSVPQVDSTRVEFPDEKGNVPRAATQVDARYSDYLRKRYPDIKPEQEGTTREKAEAPGYAPGRLLNDITRFTLTASDAESEHLLAEFRAYGYAIRAEGAKRIATGPEIEFMLVPGPPGAPRKLAIDMKLNRPKTGDQSYQVGVSELRFNGSKATWYFPAGWRP